LHYLHLFALQHPLVMRAANKINILEWEGGAAGFDQHLTKPLSYAALEQALAAAEEARA
jgi:CheY-like chemotaxis protein